MDVIALAGVPMCTDLTKILSDGSWTPSRYVGPGICRSRSMSFFFVDILSDRDDGAIVVDLTWAKKYSRLPGMEVNSTR
jgi:hypothetical protein